MDDVWKDKVDDSLARLWNEVHAIKGWMVGITVAVTVSVVLSILSIMLTLNVSGKLDGLSFKIDHDFRVQRAELAAEFRAQRAEVASQITAISNAIVAVKQQAPQFILVPAPAPDAPKN